MRQLKPTVILAATLLLTAAAFGQASEKSSAYRIVAPSRITLQGTSNVSRWNCSGSTMNGKFELAAARSDVERYLNERNVAIEPQEGGAEVRVEVPISGIDCGNRVMERDLRNALRASQHPFIHFRYDALRTTVQYDEKTHQYTAKVAGTIELAGETRSLEMPLVAETGASGRLRVRTNLAVKMSDFGITPPTAMFGMIRARNELRVELELQLEPQVPVQRVSEGGRRK